MGLVLAVSVLKDGATVVLQPILREIHSKLVTLVEVFIDIWRFTVDPDLVTLDFIVKHFELGDFGRDQLLAIVGKNPAALLANTLEFRLPLIFGS